MNNCKSQLGQDMWVNEILNGKKNGFFVEIGAHDGITLSNSYFFEKELNWKGICIEASPFSFELLKKNRDCICHNAFLDCIKGNMIDFHCSNNPSYGSELSYGINRELQTIYAGTTNRIVNLNKLIGDEYYKCIEIKSEIISDIFKEYNIPNVIDYLSIDVEGAEYNILKTIEFDLYHINTMTVEHNSPHVGDLYRDMIKDLLTSNGFTFVKSNDNLLNWDEELSQIDDYYINNNLK